jgi:hypothetical protein
MKRKIYNACLVVLSMFLGLAASHAQDNRTQSTRVADVLALFPAKDNAEADRLFQDVTNLNDEGLGMIMSMVMPSGHEEGVAPRFAVSLLTRHTSNKEQKARIERAYLKALDNAGDTEVKAYFIDNLKIIGSNASVGTLAKLIGKEGLSDQAISALMSINTADARAALQSALQQNNAPETQSRLINALGELNHQPAVQDIAKFVDSDNELVRKNALWSLALLADAASYDVLLQHAKSAKFARDPSEATPALVEYLHQLQAAGKKDLTVKISQDILTNTLTPEQQHVRLAALKALTVASPDEASKTLLKEMNRFDSEYQKEVLKVAFLTADNDASMKAWMKAYKKSSDRQADILAMLAKANRNDAFATSTLIPALKSKDPAVRAVAAEEIAYNDNKKFENDLVDYLLRAETDGDIASAKSALLRMMDSKDTDLLAGKITSASPKGQVAILNILGERRAVNHFDVVLKNISSANEAVRAAAYSALPNVSSAKNTAALLSLLEQIPSGENAKQVQEALIGSMDSHSAADVNKAYASNKARILPLLPYINDDGALEKVTTSFESGNAEEKAAAFDALLSWQNEHAARKLLAIRKDPSLKEYHQKAFDAFLVQVAGSSWPDEEKLLMYDQAMSIATNIKDKTAVLRAAGSLRTFLALVFVSRYLDDKDLNRAAGRSVMQIALPTSDARPGLTGAFVRATLQKILDKVEGQDSQYEVIDIQTYLANMPTTKGYEAIFNGQDLSGWQGLVENPIARAKMTKDELAKKQAEANEKTKESWSVKDGAIYFTGEGANLCTIRPYGDFEMLVDWKISKNGDSGIYLRGSPQVQIWDPTGKEEAAKVGSGGLYNNEKNRSTPLTVADNPVGEWNTFHIKMIGDRVTVHLNGILVVDNVVMENYWDRNLPIFPEEAIELQAHGNELAFRNLYVKELGNKPYELTSEERDNGFELLFNGKDLDNWVGNKTDYIVEDNAIAIYPGNGSHGNLYTEKEYSDFVFRFEFQLTPGANNGLGIHAPLNGDAAYGGKEIQILDNTAPVYATLQPYQYHGSVYGIIPAKKGFLRAVGDWNEEEVYVKGDQIKVVLNGTVILDGDIKKATKKGTMDHKDHPGLNRHTGHIGFLGHGTIVRFRNIRVKDLTKNAALGER